MSKSKNSCIKCKSDLEGGSTIVEAGTVYNFCKECSDILNTFSMPTNIMHLFLTPEQKQSQEARNIFAARKARLRGKGAWSV